MSLQLSLPKSSVRIRVFREIVGCNSYYPIFMSVLSLALARKWVRKYLISEEKTKIILARCSVKIFS